MTLNAISVIFLLLTIQYIRQITSQCDSIVSSTHSLARCAVRLKVSPTAKKSIREYAKTKPGLAVLLEKDALRGSLEQTV